MKKIGLLAKIKEWCTLKQYKAYLHREHMLTEQLEASITFGNQTERMRVQHLIWLNHKTYFDQYDPPEKMVD